MAGQIVVEVKKFIFNPFGENTYVAWDGTGECVVIDPGAYSSAERRALAEFIRGQGLRPAAVVCTHGHFDHVLGVQFLMDEFGAPFALHPLDGFLVDTLADHGAIYGIETEAPPARGIDLEDGGAVRFGETRLRVIHTPGHTPGHVCLFDERGGELFTGDTLFRESIGRTDLPGGDYSWIMRSILERILPLGGHVKIHPGHGPASDLGHEAMYNPFITEVMGGQSAY